MTVAGVGKCAKGSLRDDGGDESAEANILRFGRMLRSVKRDQHRRVFFSFCELCKLTWPAGSAHAAGEKCAHTHTHTLVVEMGTCCLTAYYGTPKLFSSFGAHL